MPKENKIVILRDDLPKVDLEFGITEKDRDLSEAKVLIEGKPAVRLRGDEDSVTVRAPSDVDHEGPLQIVVTTNSDKPVGILNYWWNGQKWEFHPPNPDDRWNGGWIVARSEGYRRCRRRDQGVQPPAGGTAKKP